MTDNYCKPRLGKLRQTGTIAVWLKTIPTKTSDAAIYMKTMKVTPSALTEDKHDVSSVDTNPGANRGAGWDDR